MFSCVQRTCAIRAEKGSQMFLNQTKQCRRAFSSGSKQRNFMSSMIAAAPEEEGHFALILGKPGGGKGTISCKILKVCCDDKRSMPNSSERKNLFLTAVPPFY